MATEEYGKVPRYDSEKDAFKVSLRTPEEHERKQNYVKQMRKLVRLKGETALDRNYLNSDGELPQGVVDKLVKRLMDQLF